MEFVCKKLFFDIFCHIYAANFIKESAKFAAVSIETVMYHLEAGTSTYFLENKESL